MNNIWYTWGEVFNSSLQELWWGFIQFAPKLILAIILFILGWVISSIIAKAFEQVFKALNVDKLFNKAGASEVLNKAGLSLDTGYFIGQIMRWFVLIIFILPSLALVGLESIGDFLRYDVLTFLPRVIVAAFVLIIATIVSDAISRAVLAGAKTLSLSSSHMLATVAKYAVWTFAFIVALEQLGVNSAYMQILFTGIIAMLAIAGAIAFGLGGKDHASKLISKISEEVNQK
ncbi:MAG: hypothetical protein WC011_02830 [Candidatus Paceibacterota bacterium]